MRSSKRRRASPIFTSRERKAEFEQADQELEKWADQLEEAYRPTNVVARFHQFETNSVNLSVLYYLIVMVLHRPIMINASLAANRNREGGRGGVGSGGGGRRRGGIKGENGAGETTTLGGGGRAGAVITRTGRDQARDDDFKDGSTANEADNAMQRIDDVEMESSTHTYSVEEVDEDEGKREETGNEVDMESPIDGSDNGNQAKDNVRRKLKGRRRERERTKSDYDSDDAEDLEMSERSAQRCIEAANTVIALVGCFDDSQIKYHGGHYTSTIYLAGTILIMQLSKTKDLAVQSQIHERLQVCFQFFSVLSPFWQETDEKAKTLRDLLLSQTEQQDGPSTEGDDEEESYDQDKDDEDGDDYSGGADEYDDQEGDDSGADDHGGAEQSLHDLMIADALLDLSNANRPYGQDYSWGGKSSSLPPLSSLLSQCRCQDQNHYHHHGSHRRHHYGSRVLDRRCRSIIDYLKLSANY
ncbi:hypothetical protein BGZ95_008516 [Linnemannia exigua]|uniref:Uncharacterized protein n=1 Tax=Linnemannia exigua TaxID=604196 RepID=A0AAD4DE01_9FUNG|nr:hypothetical protein BGZ95_008516 [Linnemannia exigua]